MSSFYGGGGGTPISFQAIVNALGFTPASIDEETQQKILNLVDFMNNRVGIASSGQSTAQSPTFKEKILENIIQYFSDKVDFGIVGNIEIQNAQISNIVDVDKADYMILSE